MRIAVLVSLLGLAAAAAGAAVDGHPHRKWAGGEHHGERHGEHHGEDGRLDGEEQPRRGGHHGGHHRHHDDDLEDAAPRNTLCVAHRGASGTHPENTVEAYLAAYAMGCDAIETDVQLTADGTVIILHDETMERTTNGTGTVYDLPYKGYIDSLVAGPNGERVPLFTDALDVLLDRIGAGFPDTFFIMDIKPSNPLEVVDAMAEVLKQPKYAPLYKNLYFGPWNDSFLQRILKVMPASRRTYISELPPKVTTDVESFNTNLFGLSATPLFVPLAHAAKKSVFAWTVNTVTDMKTALNLKVDAILTNYPVTLLQLLGRSGEDPKPDPVFGCDENQPGVYCGEGVDEFGMPEDFGHYFKGAFLVAGLVGIALAARLSMNRMSAYNYVVIEQVESNVASEKKKLMP